MAVDRHGEPVAFALKASRMDDGCYTQDVVERSETEAAATAEAAWRDLDDRAAATAGHRLFTATVVDTLAGLVRRSYSNMPADYPTSGTKPLKGNTGDWYETVMVQRRTFVANTIEDIAKVFPDHALIASLGCGSVVNLPIVLEDRLVATINLTGAMPLNFAAAYSDYHVTGLNPAGNASLTNLAFVADRFGIAQSRRPAAS